MQEQLDPQVVNLAKAIRQTESGGDFNIKGKSGEHGAYQFMPDTWKEYSREAGVNVPLEQATPEQQNEVAYKKIKQWKDKGLNVGQIASSWNAGPGKPNAYLEGNSGVNSKGVSYDTPAYAKSVAEQYHQYKGQSPTGTQQNANTHQPFPETPTSPTPNQVPEDPNAAGNVIKDIGKGNYSGALQSGIKNIGNATGITQLGEGLGGELAKGYEKAKGFLGGKDNSKYLSKEDDVGNILQGGAKVSGLIGGLASLGAGSGLLAASKTKLLRSPMLDDALLNRYTTKSIEKFKNMKKYADQLDFLEEGLKGATGKSKLVIEKALEVVKPLAEKELGLTPGVLKSALSKSKSLIGKGIKSALGGTAVGGGLLGIYDHFKK